MTQVAARPCARWSRLLHRQSPNGSVSAAFGGRCGCLLRGFTARRGCILGGGRAAVVHQGPVCSRQMAAEFVCFCSACPSARSVSRPVFATCTQAARPATALTVSGGSVSGSGVGSAAAELARPGSSGGLSGQSSQHSAATIAAWQLGDSSSASGISSNHAAAAASLSRFSAAPQQAANTQQQQQQQQQAVPLPTAAAASPARPQSPKHSGMSSMMVKPLFHRSMQSRSAGTNHLNIRVAVKLANPESRFCLADSPPVVERSASSLPSVSAGWGGVVSPFGAMNIAEGAQDPDTVGAANSLKTRSSIIVPALYGAAVSSTDAELGAALLLRQKRGVDAAASAAAPSVQAAAEAAAAAVADGGATPPWGRTQASAAEVLEVLHHADSCDLDTLPPQGPTFTGEIRILACPAFSCF